MIEINNESRGAHNINSQIKFKTSKLRSSLCDYSHAYILVSGTLTIADLAAGKENKNLEVVFKSSTPFSNCMSK